MITQITDKEIAQAATIEQLRQEVTAWSVTVENLEAKLAALEQEANEEDALRERLSGLLTKSVNAIRGEPAELSLHSWHDLPELCNRLVEKLADQTKAADHWMGEACKSHNDLVRANEKLAALLAQEPVAWLYEVNGRIKLETQRLDNYYWMGEGDSWVKGKPLILAEGAAPVPPGKVLVPIRMTLAMQRVCDQDDWEWADVLAAANAVTESEYADALEGAAGAAPAIKD